MSMLKAVFVNAANRLSGAVAGEAALEAQARDFLAAHGLHVGRLDAFDGEERRRVYLGHTKIDGVTVAAIVAADPDLGPLEGAVVANVAGAQLKLLRYEWSYSIASCIRFYDHLLDKLTVRRRLTRATAA